MTKLEIIEETIKYYSEDTSRRGLSPGTLDTCQYLTSNGKRCAVGRCCKDLVNFKVLDVALSNLKDEYVGHSKRFWGDLQVLHDRSYHWNNEGLTNAGKNYLNDLKMRYT